MSSIPSPSFINKSDDNNSFDSKSTIDDKQKVLKVCLDHYNAHFSSNEWEPLIENTDNMKAFIMQLPKNEAKFYLEIKLPHIDF